MAVTMHPSLAVHPGDWLKSEIVDPHGVSIVPLRRRPPFASCVIL